MQYTNQDIAQLVFGIINSRVAHIHIMQDSSSKIYSFGTGVFVGSPKEVSVNRGFHFLVGSGGFSHFIKWMNSSIPVIAQHVVWRVPPVVTRIADEDSYLINAKLELFDPFGSPVYSGELLWENNVVKRFENPSGVV